MRDKILFTIGIIFSSGLLLVFGWFFYRKINVELDINEGVGQEFTAQEKIERGFSAGARVRVEKIAPAGEDSIGPIEIVSVEGDDSLEGLVIDTDGDGLEDRDEVKEGTDINNKDTDDDGLEDKEELILKTDPLNKDSDYDGLLDGAEINL